MDFLFEMSYQVYSFIEYSSSEMICLNDKFIIF